MGLSKVFYFPEVRGGEGFSSLLTVVNPHKAVANLKVTQYEPGREPRSRTFTLAGQRHLTIPVPFDGASGFLGIALESDQPLAAERVTFFDNKRASYGAAGIAALATTWWMVGGLTQEGYTFILSLLNPNPQDTSATITFIGQNNARSTRTYVVASRSKLDVVVNEAVPDSQVAAKVESSAPIAVEDTVFVTSDELGAAYTLTAVASPANELYAPEVPTGGTANSFLLILNPGDTPVSITVAYYKGNGAITSKVYTLGPLSRTYLWVNNEVPEGPVVAAHITATHPIVGQRVTSDFIRLGVTSAPFVVVP